MKPFARIALGSMTSGLLLVAACAGSDPPELDDGTATTKSEDAGGGAKLPPPSDNDAGTTPPPKDAGPQDAKADAPVNTGSAGACGASPTLQQIGELLTGNPGPCDNTCDPGTKCCFDILAFLAGGGGSSLPGFDAGMPGGGSATGLCLSK